MINRCSTTHYFPKPRLSGNNHLWHDLKAWGRSQPSPGNARVGQFSETASPTTWSVRESRARLTWERECCHLCNKPAQTWWHKQQQCLVIIVSQGSEGWGSSAKHPQLSLSRGCGQWWLWLGSSQRLPHTCVCCLMSAVLRNYPCDCPLEDMYQVPPGTLDVLTLDIWNQEQGGCVRGEVGEGGEVWMKLQC